MTDATGALQCGQCGKTSPGDQRFCGNCGARLDVAPVGVAAPVVVATNAPSPALSPPTQRVPAGAGGATTTGAATGLNPSRERDRLLTLVNVQRVRGQFAEAMQSIDAALVLSQGMNPREIAPVHELRGDLLQTQGKWEEAQTAFEQSFALDSERTGAEKKFAEATLRIAEAKAIASGSMLGLTHDGFSAQNIADRHTAGKPGVALVASLFVPGFGQLVNGQLVKASICLGVFILTLVALRLSPDSGVLFAKIRAFVSPGDAHAVGLSREPLSPLLLTLLVLLGLTWAYSLFDAASGAGKGTSGARGVAPPAGDRSGWEV